jgi:hydrogenase small subunit
MNTMRRRDFLKWGTLLATTFGLGPQTAEILAGGLEAAFRQRKRVLWLEALGCTGCSVSLLNSSNPGIIEVLTDLLSLTFHSTVGASQGTTALDAIGRTIKEGNFYLVVEGAIPAKMPEACVFGDKPMTVLLAEACRRAELVVAAGSCAAYGGIPAAEGNETGATSVQAFMTLEGIPVARRLVNCPGCPCHPESLVGTIAYAAAKGYPVVNETLLTPDMFYKHSVHDDCPRFHYWQKQEFARQFGEEGCLFKLGCLGPLTHTNCSRRQWNGGVNWCIRAGAPCIGCTNESFARYRDFPFYRKGEQQQPGNHEDGEGKGKAE